LDAAVNRQWGWHEPQDLIGHRRIRPTEDLRFNNLVRPCREPLRGRLTTTKFVTNINWTRTWNRRISGALKWARGSVLSLGLTHRKSLDPDG